jgi:hypothetical protein
MALTTDPDQITRNKTMYDVGAGEIAWRNFLAGISRALGGLVVNGIFFLIVSIFTIQYVLPYFAPLLSAFQTTTKSLQQIQQLNDPNVLLQQNLDRLQK